MRQVGTRGDRTLALQASGALLIEGARFSESVAHLAPTTFIPKGVYRFRTHGEADRQRLDCLARGMAALAAGRK